MKGLKWDTIADSFANTGQLHIRKHVVVPQAGWSPQLECCNFLYYLRVEHKWRQDNRRTTSMDRLVLRRATMMEDLNLFRCDNTASSHSMDWFSLLSFELDSWHPLDVRWSTVTGSVPDALPLSSIGIAWKDFPFIHKCGEPRFLYPRSELVVQQL